MKPTSSEQPLLQTKHMKKRWIINSLTALRIASSILFGALVIAHPEQILWQTLTLLVIFGSDILDGHLARKWHAATRGGAIFDVTADMFFVASAFSPLIFRGILPGWILAAAAGKFIEFTVTSAILSGSVHSRPSQPALVFDTLGRLSAIMLMALPLPALLFNRYLPAPSGEYSTLLLACLITLPAAVSSAYRIRKCMPQIAAKKYPAENSSCRAS